MKQVATEARLVEGSVPEKDVMSFFGSIKSLTDTF